MANIVLDYMEYSSDGLAQAAYVSDSSSNLQSYSESTLKTQGSYSLKAVAAITASLNKTLTRTLVTPLDLTGIDNLQFDIRASRTGSNIKLGIGSNSVTAATGGTITVDGDYTVHKFLLADTGTKFIPAKAGDVEYLVIAGGGGGGSGYGGGGGAGGFRTGTLGVTAQEYTITVGDGGAGGASGSPSNDGVVGSNSVFSSITAAGGGKGTKVNPGVAAGNGGSGGGSGASSNAIYAGGTATPSGQGNNGGSNGSTSAPYPSGGGGGAGAVGGPGSGSTGGSGGVGLDSDILVDGSNVKYAGGGGGGCSDQGATNGAGGDGGGGAGAPAGARGTAGTPNTGGGGGGGGCSPYGGGGKGGSGIVVIRYLTSSQGNVVTTDITPNILVADTWQTVNWNISEFADRDAITSLVITTVNADAENTFYVDNFIAVTPNLVVDNMEYSSNDLAQAAYITDGLGALPSGGIITTDGLYTVHTFLSDGTFTPLKSGEVQVLVVAGGGGASGGLIYINWGAGGAGGTVTYDANYSVTADTGISITVGAGGAGVDQDKGGDGEDSIFGTITAGGGTGVDHESRVGGRNDNYTGGTGSVAGASGGGAGGGGNGSDVNAGIGYQTEPGASISGLHKHYGGGGSSCRNEGPGTVDTEAGGGRGTASGTGNSGTPNTGGGGGGTYAGSGGSGGSGIVIVRYLTSSQQDTALLQCYSEPTITTQGLYSLKGIAKITETLNKSLTKTLTSSIDLTDVNTLKFDIRSNRTGSNIKIGIHNPGNSGTEATGGTVTTDGEYTVHTFKNVVQNFLTGGTISASSNAGAPYVEANGLDGNLTTYWASDGGAYPKWWKYDLGSGITKIARKLKFYTYIDGAGGILKNFTLQGSNDNSNWTTVYTGLATNTGDVWQTFMFDNITAYRYYKINCTDNYRSDNYVGFYEIRLFEGSETFTPFKSGNIEILVVGGGGGGGGSRGAGGGAGGYLYDDALSVTAQSYTVTVGDGGIAGLASGGLHGGLGEDSIFGNNIIVAKGGGGGAGAGQGATNGGSGGGGSGTGTVGQGHNGGSSAGPAHYGGGGGGGASTVGANGSDSGTAEAAGGAGTANSITGTSVTYACGGYGGHNDVRNQVGASGTPNTGDGGGGGQNLSLGMDGGPGGSGIVVIRYLTSSQSVGIITEITPEITVADTWQTVTWDISALDNEYKNAIDQVIITIVDADAENIFYLDFFDVEHLEIDDMEYSTNLLAQATYITSSLGGADEYTKLIVHFNGADAATTYTAETGQVATFSGDAQLDDTQTKFGATSLRVTGGGVVQFPNHANWAFGTGAFTVDFWMRASGGSNYQTMVGLFSWYNVSTGFGITYAKTLGNKVGLYTGNDWKILSSAITEGTWIHVTLVGNGGANGARNIKMYINGTQAGSTYTADYNFTDQYCYMGGSIGWGDMYTGWLDEVRISKGIQRWTSNFTPPTSEYIVTPALQSYSDPAIKTQGSFSLKGIALIDISTDETLTRTF